jgi:hypothetical protein
MTPHRTRHRALADRPAALVVGALLALAIVAIHVKDQGGFPGDKGPGYIKVLYYVLEAAGVLMVALLTSYRTRMAGWLLAVGVAAGPIIGYVLTRGPGLPDAMDDRGNWGEPLGVASLVVEGVLLVLAVAALATRGRRTRTLGDDVYDAREAAYRRSAAPQLRD